jgi:hypothetical protein
MIDGGNVPNPPWRFSTSLKVSTKRPPIAPLPRQQSYPLSADQCEVQNDYREERAAAAPSIEDARAAPGSAVAIGQGCLKTGLLLNGIGLVAIASLFNLDAEKTTATLLWPAGSYLTGMISNWFAYLCAVYSRAHRADERILCGYATGLEREAEFYAYARADTVKAEAAKLRRRADWRMKAVIACRHGARLLAALSLVAFLVGSWTGQGAIVNGRPSASLDSQITGPDRSARTP